MSFLRTPGLLLMVAQLTSFWALSSATSAADDLNSVATSSEQRLKESIQILSADEMEGRGLGTKGIDKAADYLAAEFTKLGLRTNLFDGGPFQKFELVVSTEMGPKANNRLTLLGPPEKEGGEPRKLALVLDQEFTSMAIGGSGTVDAGLVFAGYGISAKPLGYDDYDGVDVKGKVVLLVRKEPQQKDPKSKFDGLRPSQHATFMRKLANAYEHGAIGVILVNDGLELETIKQQTEKQWKDALERMTKLQATLADPKADQVKTIAEIGSAGEDLAKLSKELQQPQDKLVPFSAAGDEASTRKMPVFFCKRGAIDPVVKAALGKSLDELEQEIDADFKPRTAPLAGWTVQGQADILQRKAQVKNVVAVLEGEGPLADETVIIGAHYDHLGRGGSGSLAPWTTDIHNGADDNASGTATMLEVARLLKQQGFKPKRRIVFMAFTGEERGLLGSAYYTRNPRFALEKTVAMYNLDMVGRLADEKLIVYGTGTAKELDGWIDTLGSKFGFKVKKDPSGFGPSDHSSFYAKKIPVLHFFTGTHGDYHRPSDDAEKINIGGMRRVAEMLTEIVLLTDALPARLEYVEVKGSAMIVGGGDADRPYFGSIPDFGSTAEGYAISGAAEGSPAAKGGLKGGDVIIGLGESKIGSLEDFDSALRKFKNGDKIKVKVLREGKEVVLEVTLAPRSR